MWTDAAAKQPKTLWKPRTPDEMKRMEQLAQAAVGFETKRGDSVVLENLSFSTNTEERAPALLDRVGSQAKDLLRSQPSLLRTIGMGICLLVLGFMVLRPLGRQAVRLLEPSQLSASAAISVLRSSANEPVDTELDHESTGKPLHLPPMVRPSTDAQNVFDRVTEHIKTEPAASTRLMQAWIGGNNEEAD